MQRLRKPVLGVQGFGGGGRDPFREREVGEGAWGVDLGLETFGEEEPEEGENTEEKLPEASCPCPLRTCQAAPTFIPSLPPRDSQPPSLMGTWFTDKPSETPQGADDLPRFLLQTAASRCKKADQMREAETPRPVPGAGAPQVLIFSLSSR